MVKSNKNQDSQYSDIAKARNLFYNNVAEAYKNILKIEFVDVATAISSMKKMVDDGNFGKTESSVISELEKLADIEWEEASN